MLAISADGVERATLSIEVAAPNPTPRRNRRRIRPRSQRQTRRRSRRQSPRGSDPGTDRGADDGAHCRTDDGTPTPTPTVAPLRLRRPPPRRRRRPLRLPHRRRPRCRARRATPTASPTPTADPHRRPDADTDDRTRSTGGDRQRILLSASDISRLPTSGAAWTALKARADGALGSPLISNQDDDTDQVVLAKALVYARTGGASYRASVLAALKSALGTESGGRTLALGRNLPRVRASPPT